MSYKWNIDMLQEFVRENSDCKILSTVYKNTKLKLEFECSCGNHFETSWEKFLRRNKRRCNKCNKNEFRTTESFKREILELVGAEYSLLDVYSQANQHIKMRHNLCGNVWKVTPNKFVNFGRRCPSCSRKVTNQNLNQRLTNGQFKEVVCGLVADEYTFQEEYKTLKTPILARHERCGHEYYVRPDNFIFTGNRCPKCNFGGQSLNEKRIEEYLVTNKIDFIKEHRFEDCKAERTLPFDFYLPNKNFIIEFHGRQHYEPVEAFGGIKAFKKQTKHDELKREYCRQNRIHLLEISYLEENQLDNILNTHLN